jgi:hypothetical protein
MTRRELIETLTTAGLDADAIAAAVEVFEDTAADREEARIESLAAAADEDAAHGYDFDADHKYDPHTGYSEYDFDPGVTYNDAGEPRGYM